MLRGAAPWAAACLARRGLHLARRPPHIGSLLPLLPAHDYGSSWMAAASVVAVRHCSAGTSAGGSGPADGGGDGGDDDDEFVFDAAETVAKDVTRLQQAQSVDGLVLGLLPTGAPRAAYDALVKRFRATPINDCIGAATVTITHIENEAGEDSKMRMPPMPLPEALQTARDNGMDLVQLAESQGTAYCRLRRETAKALAEVAPLLGAAAPAAGGGEAERPPGTAAEKAAEEAAPLKLRDPTVHQFRDVVDAHFIGWRSKKIVAELARQHPVKLVIAQFVSAAAAVNKMREMCTAVEAAAAAQSPVVGHYYTSLQVSEKDLVVLLQPATKPSQMGVVKHPGPREWLKTMERLDGRLTGSGRTGTYKSDSRLKRRNVGARTFRTDKFGRRID